MNRFTFAAALLSLCLVFISFEATAVQIVEVQVNSGNDDGEEGNNGGVDLTSSDLELTVDGADNQTVGIRFTNVTVPQGVQINKAYVQFQVDESSSATTNLLIEGEYSGNAASLNTASGNISSRARTNTAVSWAPPGWTTVGAAGTDQQTPDISTVIQEIIDRGDWSSGNSLVLIITGDGQGKRVAESYNGDVAGAPMLHIEYSMTPGNDSPDVNAGEDRTLILPEETLCLQATATDDGIPGPLNVEWTQQSGPSALIDAPTELQTTVTFPSIGNYNFLFQANDGELTSTDNVRVTVGNQINVPGDYATIQAAVDAANDGDRIILEPGIYTGTINIQGKALTIASQYINTGDRSFIDQTIIDGNKGYDIVTVGPGISGMTQFIGITVLNGVNGITGSSPISVISCHVTDTSDAIDFEEGVVGAIIRDSLIDNNKDDAVDFDGLSYGIVEGNQLINNGDDGIETRLPAKSANGFRYIFKNNIITGNGEDGIQTIGSSGGSSNAELIISGNLIAENANAGISNMCCGQTTEAYEGAALPEKQIIYNNTFRNNNHGIIGGDNVIAVNNIFVGHEVALKRMPAPGSIAANNALFGNTTDFVNVNSDTNLFFDPQLNVDGTLGASSPAIDAGVSQFSWENSVAFTLSNPMDYSGSAPDLGAFQTPVNTSPTVYAGADQLIEWSPDPVDLSGTASDDGLPSSPLSVTWTQLTGPCGVVLSDAHALQTTATFDTVGTYVFELTADDGRESRSDQVTIELSGSVPNRTPVANDDTASTAENTAVTVDVGANDTDPDGNLDVTTINTACATCSLPTNGVLVNNGDGTLTYTPNSGFSGTDSFVYEVCDTEPLCATASVAISVTPASGSTQIEVRVSSSSDDAEEKASSGKMYLNSSDLELVDDTSKSIAQVVGVRFAGVAVPQGATILAAYVQFQVDETSIDPANLSIAAEASDNALTFSNSSGNVSSRVTTSSVSWSPAAWPTTGEAGVDQQTSDLSGLIQQVVDRSGWQSGNAIALIFRGSGKRTAEAYDGQAGAAPLLKITYSTQE